MSRRNNQEKNNIQNLNQTNIGNFDIYIKKLKD